VNQYTTPIQSTLLTNQLAQTTGSLQSQINPTGAGIATLEDAISIATQQLSKFYRRLGKPLFEPINAVVDTIPDPTEYNNNLQMVLDDLAVLFSELENMENVVLQSFNYIVSRLDRLQGRLKNVSSQLGDYVLYSTLPTKDAIFFSDSFSNVNRIEVNSPLLNNTQCEISQVEGLITLPIDRTAQAPVSITDLPAINSNSNGLVGNNHEVGTTLHGDISTVLDNNPDTWFEYERVVATNDGVALVLDITVNLSSEKIINFIRINPNNFGTRTQVKIEQIDTSTDGKTFVSIKDEIPISGYSTIDEENVFVLAPSSSKFAGQGLFTFTPRFAKYVRLVLKQTTPYLIQTKLGQQFRYGIGIRDIEVAAQPYLNTGELISTEFSSSDEIKKIVLLSNQNPDPAADSKLASIEHFVSPDNGVSWYQLRPKVSEGLANISQTIPELIDFNGVSNTTVSTSSPVYKIRYKTVLKRDDAAFSTSSAELAQEILTLTELHTPPSTTPFTIDLQQTPIEDSIKLVDVNYGARGFDDNPYTIAVGRGTKQRIHLAIPLKRDKYKSSLLGIIYMGAGGGSSQPGHVLLERDPQTIYVDGEEWTNELNGSSTSGDKHYYLDFEENILYTGDGSIGKAVPDGATISMTLAEERLYPGIGTDHIAQLDYSTVADQGQVELFLVKETASKVEVLKAGATKHQLQPYISTAFSPVFSDNTIFSGSSKDYPSEVTAGGDWYVNRTTGYLTHYTPIPVDTVITVGYVYTPRQLLSEDDWDFVDMGGGAASAVSIHDNAYKTFSTVSHPYILPAGVNHFSLAHLAVVPGSLVFTTPSGVIASGVYGEEVPFIDGRTELLGVVPTTQAISSILGIITETSVIKDFDLPISSDTTLEIVFSNNNVFTTDVSPSAPASVGEYSIDRAGRQFTVRVDEDIVDPGYVDYYYNDPQANVDGRYSVNSENGEVFLHDKTGAVDKVVYEYTNYVIRYPIARPVEPTDWTLDKRTNQITIKDREILKNMRQAQAPGRGLEATSKYYQVSYNYVSQDRANLAELKVYFSPILRDYALKVITGARLI